MEHLFDMRPERPGYRLHRLEVFNWGTFDSQKGQVYRFEPEGRTSLLVGHNGSGKSTLVDAILTLLVDSRTRNYNVAAGAKKTERTPKSYIKGAFDRTADETQVSVVRFLRPQGNYITAISAVFRDEHLKKSFTLTQVLYLKTDGSDAKVYAIKDGDRELKEELTGLQMSDRVLSHFKQRGYQTTRAYVEYQGWLTKRTHMRGKAIDMFNQTVAVKDIQSLNTFIRHHMLEADDWRDRVQKLLTHFNDLSLAHQELERAKRQEKLLAPIEEFGAEYCRQAEDLEQLEQQIAAACTFFPMQTILIFEPEIATQQTHVTTMATTIKRLDEHLRDKREAVRQLTNELEWAGGERLKQIPGLIKLEEAHLQHKRRTFDRFHENLKVCRIEEIVGSPEVFQQARERQRKIARASAEKIAALKIKNEETAGTKGTIVRRLRDERAELEVLQQRRTNLPARFTELRSGIFRDLQLDERVLPFAAELIAVSPDERRWEASAEMVLRSFALSLLVPERFYRRVRTYVEGNRMTDGRGQGQRLDYICVGKTEEPDGDRIGPQSLFTKLQFKARHDLTPWVKGQVLRRFDFHCCRSVEEFNDVRRFAMTENRHVKFHAERHQKDDRARTIDPRHFVLGWDNTEKKRRIAERICELEAERQVLDHSIARCDKQIDDLQGSHRAATAALEVTDFDEIDVKRHQDEIAALQAEKQQLEESNDAVKSLRKRLGTAEAEEERLRNEHIEQLLNRGKLEDEIKRVRRMVGSSRAEVQAAKDSGEFNRHEGLFDTIRESIGEPALSIENFEQRRRSWETSTRRQIDERRKPLQTAGEKLMVAMARFLKEFQEEQDDLDASVKALESFLAMLEQLRREDLPRYEKKFKDRLNDQVTQEVALFNTALRQECKQIEERIAQLNQALASVEYNPGTSMQLEPRQVHDREIDDFRRSLSECLDGSLEHTDEANQALFLRVKALVERLGDKEGTRWRNKVIDVRNWYDFAAQEIERESQDRRSCYDGSSGQSGGEKAKLAFTILVAALAYQFDVDPSGNIPGRFQFVVVDEMFSRVDDQNARYALKLFQQFGLQLLIVAPLDAKARVTEPFVDRYALAQKDPVTNHSQLYSMTAIEYEEVVQQFSGNGRSKSKRRLVAK